MALFSPLPPLAVLGTLQLAVTARFWGRLRRDFSSPRSAYAPSVSVLIPCKGDAPSLAANVEALLRQDYGGAQELLFVVPSEKDPAHARLKALTGLHAKARLLVSNAVPRRCSGKNLDLLHALKSVAPRTEVLVFADSDVRVGPSWLRDLVAPLADPEIAASTAPMLYLPAGGLASFLRSVWMGAGIPYLELTGCLTGQSMAIRVEDFESSGAPQAWERSLMDDLSLGALLKKAGKRVRFAARAMPYSTEACDLGGFVEQVNRWITAFKIYDRPVWLLGLTVTFLKTWVLAWCLARSGARWEALGLLLGADALNLLLLFSLFWRYFKDRPLGPALPWLAALAAPLLQVVYFINFQSSLFRSTIRWGGRSYRVRGPLDVEVL